MDKRGDKRRRKERDACRRQEARLDEALAETFPASDPIAAGEPTGTEALALPVDRKPPLIDTDEVAAVARRGQRRS